MIAFIIVTDLFRTARFLNSENLHLGTRLSCALPSLTPSHHTPPPLTGPAWYINMLSWVFSYVIVFGVIWTGKAADKGRKWAAGNRAYTRIGDRE
jgi:hypothetical protein